MNFKKLEVKLTDINIVENPVPENPVPDNLDTTTQIRSGDENYEVGLFSMLSITFLVMVIIVGVLWLLTKYWFV